MFAVLFGVARHFNARCAKIFGFFRSGSTELSNSQKSCLGLQESGSPFGEEMANYMSKLFNNAVESIVVGIEDYRQNSRPRALSAVRNFYTGTLLLAKEILVRKVPGADPDEILGAKYTCSICDEQLTPDNVDIDNHGLCSYHGYVLSKDD